MASRGAARLSGGDSGYAVGDIAMAVRWAGEGYVLGVNTDHAFNSSVSKPSVAGTAEVIADGLDPSAWARGLLICRRSDASATTALSSGGHKPWARRWNGRMAFSVRSGCGRWKEREPSPPRGLRKEMRVFDADRNRAEVATRHVRNAGDCPPNRGGGVARVEDRTVARARGVLRRETSQNMNCRKHVRQYAALKSLPRA